MKHIKFVKWHGPYQAGQWATFPEKEADRLVKSGRAVFHDPNSADAPPKRPSVTAKSVTK